MNNPVSPKTIAPPPTPPTDGAQTQPSTITPAMLPKPMRPKYAFTSEKMLLSSPIGDRYGNRAIRDGVHKDLAPANTIEGLLVDDIAIGFILKGRVMWMEREVFEKILGYTPNVVQGVPSKLGQLIASTQDVNRLKQNGTLDFLDWVQCYNKQIDDSIQQSLRVLEEYRKLQLNRKRGQKETDHPSTGSDPSPALTSAVKPVPPSCPTTAGAIEQQ